MAYIGGLGVLSSYRRSFSTNEQSTKMLGLYKELLKAAKSIPQYNYREYSVRRIKYAFRESKNISHDLVPSFIQKAQSNLQLIKRQALIQSLYYDPASDKLVLEKYR